MISAIVTTLNDERQLGATLAALVPAAVDGLVREVLLADAGSTDATAEIAEDAGAAFVVASPGDRDGALAAACAAARGPWLLILGAGSRLQPGWEAAAGAHIEARPDRAGWFRLRIDGRGPGARWREAATALRSGLARRPGLDQGLLVSKRLFEAAGGGDGGFDRLVRRLGPHRLLPLAACAATD